MASFAPKGHARLDPRRPMAFAVCDRCGFMYRHQDLQWDTQYHGKQIRRTGFLVCRSCNDIPNPTLRPIVLPPDPVPILNPRPEPEHCHVFKPRADQLIGPPQLDGFPRNVTADTVSRIWPPIDDTHPDPVTVDAGDVCDTKPYTPPVPIGPPVFPVVPPILPPDATTDNANATADTTGTTADASPILPAVTIEFNTADTTQVYADNGIKLTNVIPLYLWQADMDTAQADNLIPTADTQL